MLGLHIIAAANPLAEIGEKFGFNQQLFIMHVVGFAIVAFALHRWAGFVVILLAGMHIVGALFHYVVRRDNVLQRMLPRRLGGV